MKNFKWAVLAMACLMAVFTFSSCNDDDDTYLPPDAAIQQALKAMFPNATNIEWDQKGVYYVAECWVNGVEKDVWFDANANWVMTETELNSINNLPSAVYTAFINSEYASWVVEDVEMLEYPLAPTTEYMVEVENTRDVALYYSPEGGLLSQKDVTDKDNENLPRQ